MVDARLLSSTDTEAKLPLLSIVITSYTTERLKDILELLDNIKTQTYTHIETIFVAERSLELADKVKKYIREQSIRNVKVLFNNGEPGASTARNLGIKQAEGDIIAFVDDDIVLSPDWSEEMVKTYEDASIIGVTGPILPLWEDERMNWFPNELDWMIGCSSFSGVTERREVRNVWGANMSFKREAFNAGGLFLTHLGAIGGGGGLGKQKFAGEETELSLRVRRKTGNRILYNPDIRVQHKVYKYRFTPMFIARRAYSEGYTKAMFNRIYQDKDSGEKLLSTEHQLLKRILDNLLPDTVKGLLRNPIIAWRKLSVTITVLFFVTLGYYSYLLSALFNRQKATDHDCSTGGNR